MRISVPSGIDLQGLNRTQQDTSAYILHLLAKKSKTERGAITHPVGLHRNTLYALAGKEYHKLIMELEGRGILSVKESYCVGRNTKQYQIKDPAPLEHYNVLDPLTLKRISAARQKQTKYTLLVNPHLQRQYDFIKFLEIDSANARKQIRNAYSLAGLVDAYKRLCSVVGYKLGRELAEAFILGNSQQKKRLRRQVGLTPSSYRTLTAAAIGYRKLKRREIEVSTWEQMNSKPLVSLKLSSRTGRLFSNVTGAPKDVRKMLTYKGEALVEIDAASAQWAMLVNLLSRNTIDINKVLDKKKSNKHPNKDRNQTTITTQVVPTHLYCVSLEMELKKMGDLVRSGKFNSYMHQRTRAVGNALNVGGQRPTLFKLPESEKQTKHLLISRVLFENPKRPYLKDELAYITFKREFPNVLRCIEYLKTDGYLLAAGDMPTDGKPYAALALRLQAMEAEMFVHLLPEYINVPYCTIHDAVLAPVSHRDAITSALEALISEYGLPMTIRG